MLKKINSILFYASDVKKTAIFYTTLGFTVTTKESSVTAKLGNFELNFIDKNTAVLKKEANLEPKGVGMFIYVEVEDVDRYWQFLQEKGIETSNQPKDWPWGNREFALRDPDGYKLIFYKSLQF